MKNHNKSKYIEIKNKKNNHDNHIKRAFSKENKSQNLILIQPNVE
jgi:hypothetical protein